MKKELLVGMFWAVFWGGMVPLQAQSPASVRTEISVAEDDSPFSVLTLGRLGITVVMRQNDLFSSRSERKLYFYDENLVLRWQADLPMESTYNYLGYEVEPDSIRFVLTVLPEKSELPAFLEIAVCLADGNFSKRYHSVDVSELYKASVEGVCLAGKDWHFLSKDKDSYRYYKVDARIDSAVCVKVADAKDYDCCHLQWDMAGNRAYILFRDADRDEKELYLQIVRTDALEVERIVVASPRADLRLIDGKLALLGEGRFLIGGTWNLASSKQHASVYDRGTETAGLFLMRYRDGHQEDFHFLYYLDFPKLDTLLSEEESYKLLQARQKANGRMILPDYLSQVRFFEQEGVFHLLSETYERILTTTTDVSYDFYGRMIPYTRTRFEGFAYRNAFYAVADSSGRISDMSVFNIAHTRYDDYLSPIAALARDTSGGGLLYAYVNQGSVYYRSLNATGGVSPVHSFRLSPLLPNDRVQKTWDEGLVFWYPDCFLSYGYQQLLNPRRKGKSRQNVFYMNKLSLKSGKSERTESVSRKETAGN